MKKNNVLKPKQYIEDRLLTLILNGTYQIGSALPNERNLAQELGVTRPTLREALQRLARDGWIKIRHGKSTIINDYWNDGGLGLLRVMAEYVDFMPDGFVEHLLEARIVLLPAIAAQSISNNPRTIKLYLEKSELLKEDAAEFVQYDWDLQILMAKESKNPIFLFIFNNFAPVYEKMALGYFTLQKARDLSKDYYKKLIQSINENKTDIEEMVREDLMNIMRLWNETA